MSSSSPLSSPTNQNISININIDRLAHLESQSRIMEPSAETFEKFCNEAIDFCAKYIDEHSKNPKSKAWIDYDPEKVRQESVAAFSKIPEQLPAEKSTHEEIFSKENIQSVLGNFKEHAAEKGMIGVSPNFFGYVLGGGMPETALGDLIAAITNRFSGFFAAQPGPVLLENHLVKFIGTELGFFDPLISAAKTTTTTADQQQQQQYPNDCFGGGGYFASGTSTATISAFALAREKHNVFLGTKEYANAVVYMTKEAHSCLGKALHLLGCGHVKMRVIPCYGEQLKYQHVKATSSQTEQSSSSARADPTAIGTRYLAMDVEYLEKQMKEDVEVLGLKPWLVVGSAGTVNTGALDDLTRIGEIAKRYGAMFHVDGAMGGNFALVWKKILEEEEENENSADFMSIKTVVDTIRKGLALADTSCIDQHKGMFLSFGCGLLLVKDVEALVLSHDKNSDANYLHNFLKDSHSSSSSSSLSYPIIHSSDLSPELSKHNRTFRLFIPLQLFGLNPFRCALHEKLLLARYFAIRLRQACDEEENNSNISFPTIEIIPPQVSVVAFRISNEFPNHNSSSQEKKRSRHYLNVDGEGNHLHKHEIEKQQEEEEQEDEHQRFKRINHFTLELERAMFKRGNSFASPTTLSHGTVRWLRACFMTFRCHKTHIDQLVEEIVTCAKMVM